MSHIAAIDIGSNAIRLAIGNMGSHQEIEVFKKFREPVRLGKDVFADGNISKKTLNMAIECFSKFRQIMKDNNVVQVRAIATSALREAKNRNEFIKEVFEQTGIQIKCIDGMEEARLVFRSIDHKMRLDNKNAVIIDIGGGSVELIVCIEGKVKAMQSFKLGTVRLLQMMEEGSIKEKALPAFITEKMSEAKKFLNEATKGRKIDLCVGTGGNFECLGKLRVALLNKTSIYSMSALELQELYKHLTSMSLKERIQFLRIRADRADVVVPASLLALAVMTFADCELLSIPYVGLRDGVLLELSESLAVRSVPRAVNRSN